MKNIEREVVIDYIADAVMAHQSDYDFDKKHELGFGRNRKNNADDFKKWLFEDFIEPIKLTGFEHEFLKRSCDLMLNYIARDFNESLVVSYSRLDKTATNKYWVSKSGAKYLCPNFYDLFQFIKWEDEEPYSIEELLKAEVID